MASIKAELARDTTLVQKIQRKLPRLFQIAELESSRAGKVGMEVGSLRERIIVALLIYKFGEENVETEIPITQPEIDVEVHNTPISIKTLTSKGFGGVKLVWTVDAESAVNFSRHYRPSTDMVFVQLNWGNKGAFYYIPLSVQQQLFKRVTRERYIKLPKAGTNPRGVEITGEALEELVDHPETLKIEVDWKKEKIAYNQFERWVELWEEE